MNRFKQIVALAAHPAVLVAVLVALLLSAHFVSSSTIQIWTFVLINTLLAHSINVLTGAAGQISLGHAAFLGMGSYGSALLMSRLGLPLPLSLLGGMLLGALAGWLLSFAAGRVREFYLAMMTLGFGMIFFEVLREWNSVTGGMTGLSGIPSPTLKTLTLFGWKVDSADYFRIVLLVTAGVTWMLHNLLSSPYGRAYFAIQASEVAAGSIGIHRVGTKRQAYVASAALAALAGGFYAHLVGYLGPDGFGLSRSIEALVMAVVGGLGSLAGPVLGALLFTYLPEKLQVFAEWQYVIYGLILTLTFVLLPNGLAGLLLPRRRYVRSAALARAQGVPPVHLATETVDAGVPRLRAANITKSFQGLRALDGVSIDISAGRIVGLVGPNGSGKSTLVNVISGVYRPDAGAVSFDGQDITGLPDHEVALRGVLRTFQDPRLVPSFTVRENVLLGLHRRYRQGLASAMLGLPGAIAEDAFMLKEVDAALELAGLQRLADAIVRDLPYGDQRMTELARVLVTGAKVVMLDEPAAGLSEVELANLGRVLKDLKARGIAVVLIEHHMEFLEELVDDVVVLDAGRCIYQGTMQGMYRDPSVVEAYLGKPAGAKREIGGTPDA